MARKVNITLSVTKELYDQMKQHPEIDWNEAAVIEISNKFAAAGITVDAKGHQNPKQNHHKL